MSPNVTMPEIPPKDFPAMNDDVWVWDTWSLTDENANQISYKAGMSSSPWLLTGTRLRLRPAPLERKDRLLLPQDQR